MPKKTRRKLVIPRVPRTRAGGTWTEAQFWCFIRSNLRKMSMKWPPMRQAKDRCRRANQGKSKSHKWQYQCGNCQQWYYGSDVNVHHIEPCGQLYSWEHIETFLRRLLCEPEMLVGLCKECHAKEHE